MSTQSSPPCRPGLDQSDKAVRRRCACSWRVRVLPAKFNRPRGVRPGSELARSPGARPRGDRILRHRHDRCGRSERCLAGQQGGLRHPVLRTSNGEFSLAPGRHPRRPPRVAKRQGQHCRRALWQTGRACRCRPARRQRLHRLSRLRSAVAGTYAGYDGPGPPWNDLAVHHDTLPFTRWTRRSWPSRTRSMARRSWRHCAATFWGGARSP